MSLEEALKENTRIMQELVAALNAASLRGQEAEKSAPVTKPTVAPKPVAKAPAGIKLAGDSTIIYQYDSTKVVLNIMSGPGTIQYAWGETTAFTTVSATVNFVGWGSFTIPKPAMEPLPVLRLSFSGMSSHPAYDATKGDLRFYVQ